MHWVRRVLSIHEQGVVHMTVALQGGGTVVKGALTRIQSGSTLRMPSMLAMGTMLCLHHTGVR